MPKIQIYIYPVLLISIDYTQENLIEMQRHAVHSREAKETLSNNFNSFNAYVRRINAFNI